MNSESKRIYINNLPDNFTNTDLEKKFAEYGLVLSIEIKQRKNLTANQTPRFAYVQVKIDNYNLQQCIEEVSNNKWKGNWIQIQEAKESFMDRLRREREEQTSTKTTPKAPPQSHPPIYPDDIKQLPNVINTRRKYHSSSSESSDDQEDSGFTSSENIHKQKDGLEDNLNHDQEHEELVIKNNKHIKNVGLKINIPGIKDEGVVAVSSIGSDASKRLGVKEAEADLKRLQSIAQMKKGYHQQKSLIKNALTNIDNPSNKKIIFDDDGKSTSSLKKRRLEENGLVRTKEKKKNKLSLFEDGENDVEDSYNFEVKDQFEGKKGQKLMELQSRFKNDKRFAMDARFLEEQSEEEPEETAQNEAHQGEITYEEEKQKEYDILEEVLGKKIKRFSDTVAVSKKHKMMLRFDPSQPAHSKYEVTTEQPKKQKTKKKQKETESKMEEVSKPDVSKETFYNVADDLKDSLRVDKDFSLANLFSKEIENAKNEGEELEMEEPNVPCKTTPKKASKHDPNPFRYDSSSDEEIEKNVEEIKKVNPLPVPRSGSTRLWTESFFFKPDDYRLQEGFDFIKRLEVADQGEFGKVRRSIKEIVKAKVRNNQRNNRPFKRKLGGKKRIKVKKALKR